MGAVPPQPRESGGPFPLTTFSERLLTRYRAVRALVKRGATEGERAAARHALDALEAEHPGLGASSDEPAVRRRESAPPPPPSWSVHRVPDPPPHPSYDPRHNIHAPGGRVVWVDPDAFNGRPWEAHRKHPSPYTATSRWDDRQPRYADRGVFNDLGMLPEDYGKR